CVNGRRMPTQPSYSFAERLERLAVVIVGVLVVYLAFVGLLSITRGTPVQTVIAEGDRAGPPPPTDSLFAQTMEMYTGTHVAGGEVALLRRLRWYSVHNATDRSHVRVVVVDGRVGYTGGFGLADYWLGDGLHEGQWRESNVRFEGPAAMQLQAAFASAWAEAT